MTRTRTITVTIGSMAAGALLATGITGLALADDSTPPSSTPPAAGSIAPPQADAMRGPGPDGGRHGGMHAMRGGPAGEPLHGEMVVKADDGTLTTVSEVRGEVTAVSATSITVKAEDGYTATFAITADTDVRAGLPPMGREAAASDTTTSAITDVSAGDVAHVHGTVVDGSASATAVHAMTAEEAATMEQLRADRQQEHADRAAASGSASPASTTQAG